MIRNLLAFEFSVYFKYLEIMIKSNIFRWTKTMNAQYKTHRIRTIYLFLYKCGKYELSVIIKHSFQVWYLFSIHISFVICIMTVWSLWSPLCQSRTAQNVSHRMKFKPQYMFSQRTFQLLSLNVKTVRFLFCPKWISLTVHSKQA